MTTHDTWGAVAGGPARCRVHLSSHTSGLSESHTILWASRRVTPIHTQRSSAPPMHYLGPSSESSEKPVPPYGVPPSLLMFPRIA